MSAIDTAERAKRLLNSDIFTDAVSEVKDDILRMWMNSKSNDAEGREELYREFHGLKAVEAKINAKIDAGLIEEKVNGPTTGR